MKSLSPQRLLVANVGNWCMSFILLFISFHFAHSQNLTVNETASASSIANLLTGQGVAISNVNVKCNTTDNGRGYGLYTSTIPNMPITEGLLITTGRAAHAIGPNNSNSRTGDSGANAPNDSIRSLMSIYSGKAVREYCLFEFDIVPQGDSIYFDYVFGSEEYNEYVNSNYNDAFAFFIQGPGIVPNISGTSKRNLAIIPNGSNMPVTINNVNNGYSNGNSNGPCTNCAYYQNNMNGNTNIQYDGYTKNLYAVSKVIPCSTYRLQLVVADCSDRQFDSGVFIEKIRSNAVNISATSAAGVPYMIEGCNDGKVIFTKPTASAAATPVNYWISGSAVNGVDYAQIGTGGVSTPRTITFPGGATTVELNIHPYADGVDETNDTVVVSLFNIACPSGPGSLVKIGIKDSIGATLTPQNPVICAGASTPLQVSGALSYSWYPATYVNTTTGPNVNASLTFSDYVYVDTHVGACTETERVWVHVNQLPDDVPAMLPVSNACIGGATEAIIPQPQSGIQYQLYQMPGNTPVGSVQIGGTDTLTFVTPNLTSGSSFGFQALDTASGCARSLSSALNVSVGGTPTHLSIDQDERACYVSGNNWISFDVPGTNRVLAAIHPNGENLGWVKITSYVASSYIDVAACNTNPLTQPQFVTAALGRRWVVNPEQQPNNPIQVRLFINQSEYVSAQTAANSNANPNDDINSISQVALSKYSGPNEDGIFSNNCNTGGVTSIYSNNSTGSLTAFYSGFVDNGSYLTYTIPSCSEMWLHGFNSTDPSPLPVVLESFSASCETNEVALTWATESESNNDYFSVQIASDAYNWKEVARVEGQGNSNEKVSYAYTYKGSRGLQSYFRIVQYDYNGDSEEFPPVSVYCDLKNEWSWQAFPNPNQGRFYVQVNSAEETQKSAQLILMDVSGKAVYKKEIEIMSGSNLLEIDGWNPAQGSYILRINGSGFEDLTPLKIVVN